MDAGLLGTSDGEEGSGAIRPQKGKRIVVGKYTRHACAQCKKAKTKCEGGKPVCERCQKTGHECNWSLEDARRPLTRAHEQALKHQNALLRAEVERLSREIEALRLRASADPGSPNRARVGSLSSPGQEGITSIHQEQHLATSPSVSLDPHSASVPSTSSMHEVSTAEPKATLWGLVPVEDIGSDAQEDFDIAASDSEDDRRGPETEFDSDMESTYESDEDSDDSDADVDKALVAPTKTLFSEQDDLHHFGLTSVFRLRRRASHRKIQSRTYRASGSAASGYDSVSSAQGIRSSRSGHKSLHSFLSSSSANETGQSARAGHSDQHASTRAAGPSQARMRLKRDRKGKGRTKASARRASSPVRTQRHVLLVGDLEGGTWKGCDCQSDCWNRWLPKGVPLSRREHDILLDRVFLFFTSWCMRIIPEYFLRDMYTFLHPTSSRPTSPFIQKPSTSLPKLAHYSPFLHNILIAVGTAFSSDPEIRRPETRARFAEEGKAYIEDECSRPNISTVQALGLLASYYSGQGQQTLGFTYFGMSARIAQALGLFADCTPLLRAGRLRPRQVSDRTWCFHMAAAQDACWSMYVGRECGIPLPLAKKHDQTKSATIRTTSDSENLNAQTIGLELPNISMDDPFCLGIISAGETGERLDMMTWRMRGGSNEVIGDNVPQCKTFTTLQWSCQLMKIGRSIMDLMNRLALSDNGTEIKLLVADIDIQLDAWRQDLPAELKLTPANEMSALPHKLMMHSAFWWQHILLHRPFYQRHRAKSVDSLFSVARCNVAAREILYTLRLWRRIYGTVRYCPITLIQTIFAAGTIYILQAMQATTGRRTAMQSQASALNNMEELIGFLRECSESWECAIRIAVIFEKLLKEQRRAMEGGVNPARRSAKKKRRRLETLKETETAVHAAQLALSNRTPVLSDARTDDSGGGGELSSPAIVSHASSSFSQSISAGGSQYPLFFQFGQTHPGVSPVLNSPVADATHVFGHSSQATNSLANDCRTGLPGANVPSYPTGYLSDESYASDAPYMSTDDRDLPMSAITGQPTSAFDFDFTFLLNSEVNMDAVMPGMGMFDPIGLPGLALGPATTDGMTYDDPQSGLYPSGVDAYATLDNMEGLASDCADIRTEMNLSSNGEDDRALYDMLVALNNPQQFRL